MRLTEQEAFNKAFVGLYKQGFERSKDDVACRFRDPFGRKCAIGQLLTDEQYSVIGENNSIYAPLDFFPEVFGGLSEFFVGDLQYAHDSSDNPQEMEEKLRRVARQYDLTVPTREQCDA